MYIYMYLEPFPIIFSLFLPRLIHRPGQESRFEGQPWSLDKTCSRVATTTFGTAILKGARGPRRKFDLAHQAKPFVRLSAHTDVAVVSQARSRLLACSHPCAPLPPPHTPPPSSSSLCLRCATYWSTTGTWSRRGCWCR